MNPKLFYPLVLFLISLTATGQDQSPKSMSLQECIDYALKNNESTKSAELEKENSIALIGETRALGLPQINGNVGINKNLRVQTSFIQDFISPSIYRVLEEENLVTSEDRGAPATFPAQFGTPWAGNAGISVSQLLFNGSYFVGLRAARTVKELSSKQHIKSQLDVIEAVSKSYYGVLVAQENLSLIAKNFSRLDTLLYETSALAEEGFAESIDVKRIKVQHNNLKTLMKTTTEGLSIMANLLKFQMGMPMTERISLSDNLDDIELTPKTIDSEFDPSNRIEYSILQTNRELALLDMKNNKVQYLPNLYASYNLGWTSGTNTFSDMTDFSDNWFRYSAIGVALNVPIFDGLQKKYKIQQTKVQQSQIELTMQQVENSIRMEIIKANSDYNMALEDIKLQDENRQLAKEIYEVARIKYNEGVGSNLEVLEADASYKEAQTNYFGAVYDALVAKVDIEKAYGTLSK